MAFQPINYAAIAPLRSAFATLPQTLMAGMQAGAMPGQLRRGREAQELANQIQALRAQAMPEQIQAQTQGQMLANRLRELQAQYYPQQQEQAQRLGDVREELMRAQAQQAQREAELPFGGKIAPGAVGQAMWLQRLKESYGEDSPIYQEAKEGVEFEKQRGLSTIERNKMLANSMQFRLMPADEKRRVLASAVGLGLDPTEAAQLLSTGTTLQQIADKQGKKLDEITPIYPLQGEEIRQTRNRRAFAEEIGSLENNLADATKGYGRRFFSYSPSQVLAAISNRNPEEQGKFLAARALQPELSSLRLKAAGGTVGIEAIREMQSASLGNVKVFEGLVSDEARQSMNKYISKWISEAVDTYTNAIERGATLKPEKQEQEQSNYKKYRTKTIGGKQYKYIDGEWYSE